MRQLDLFSSPDLDKILTGPGGEVIESTFAESNSVEELQNSIKGMMNYLSQNMKSGNKDVAADYDLRTMGDVKQFMDNLMFIIDNSQDMFSAFKG